jgi:hypothetical protein
MRVENPNQLVIRTLEENPERGQTGLQSMIDRNRREPLCRLLIDAMAEGQTVGHQLGQHAERHRPDLSDPASGHAVADRRGRAGVG